MKAKLPKSWESAPLGDVCKTLKGKKPKNSGEGSKDRKIPYINIKAFETGIPVEYAEPGNYPECSKDDVLIVWDGARSGLTGRGVAGYIGSTLSKIWSDIIDNGYLYYFLHSQYNFINTNTKGVGIPHVDPNVLFTIDFPIAPENEQKRIVAEIEKQFSRLDEAVENLKRVKANLKRYKASVLKAAVEGKLTEDWRKNNPDVESADKLLDRILTERRKKWEETELAKMKARGKVPRDDKWKKKYKEPEKPDIMDLPNIPSTWGWARLDAISEIKGGITKDSKRKVKNAKELPYLRVANVQKGFLSLDKIKYIKVSEDKLPDFLLEYGDILFNEGGDRDKLGRGWIWESQIEECTFQNHVFRARLYLKEIKGKLFSLYGNTFGQKYFMAKGKQTTNLASINKTMLSAFPVPLPPTDEQIELIKQIEKRLSIVSAIEKELSGNLLRSDRLRQSILKKAFSGRLTKA